MQGHVGLANACLLVTVMHPLHLTDAADDSWNSLAV